MRDLRFACAGGWHIHTDRFLDKVREYPGCSISAVWDPDPDRGKERAGRYECGYAETYEKLLEDVTIDGVLITSPTRFHFEQIKMALKAGKHVFVEKPAFDSVEEAVQVRDLINETGRSFVMSDPIRTSKRQLLCAKNMMDSGKIGKVTMARTRCAMPMALNYSHLESFRPDLTGGGIMMDLGCHAVHMLYLLLGKPEKVHGAFGTMSSAALEYGVEDNAIGLYEFSNGVLGIAETSAVAERREDFFLISGTKGSIYCLDKKLQFRSDEGEWTAIPQEVWPEEGTYPLYSWIDSIWSNEKIKEGGIEETLIFTEMITGVYKAKEQFIKI